MSETHEIADARLDRLERASIRHNYGSVVRRLTGSQAKADGGNRVPEAVKPEPDAVNPVAAKPRSGGNGGREDGTGALAPSQDLLDLLRILSHRIDRMEHQIDRIDRIARQGQGRRARLLRGFLWAMAFFGSSVIVLQLVGVIVPRGVLGGFWH